MKRIRPRLNCFVKQAQEETLSSGDSFGDEDILNVRKYTQNEELSESNSEENSSDSSF